MTRQEHLAWCKKRALEYVDSGDPRQGLSSMLSDLTKHNETCNHPAIHLAVMLMLAGSLSTAKDIRDYITGFN